MLFNTVAVLRASSCTLVAFVRTSPSLHLSTQRRRPRGGGYKRNSSCQSGVLRFMRCLSLSPGPRASDTPTPGMRMCPGTQPKIKAPLQWRGASYIDSGRGGGVCRFPACLDRIRRILGGLRGLAEPLPQRAKLGDLRPAELVISIFEIGDRLVEPLRLVLRGGANYAAAHDVLEHFIPSLIEWRLRLDFPTALTVSLSGHEC